jgi:hypothetical protein
MEPCCLKTQNIKNNQTKTCFTAKTPRQTKGFISKELSKNHIVFAFLGVCPNIDYWIRGRPWACAVKIGFAKYIVPK